MSALDGLVIGLTTEDELRHFNELLASWPVSLVLTCLYGLLALLIFRRVAGDDDDGPAVRRARAVVVALGVFIVLVVLLPSLVGELEWVPVWLRIVPCLWLFAMWLYYFIRFMTAQRPGPGDPETRRRGAALEQTLGPMIDETGHRDTRPSAGR